MLNAKGDDAPHAHRDLVERPAESDRKRHRREGGLSQEPLQVLPHKGTIRKVQRLFSNPLNPPDRIAKRGVRRELSETRRTQGSHVEPASRSPVNLQNWGLQVRVLPPC